jgi:hypothetical protein
VTTLTQLTFFIYENHHSNEEEASIIIIFIILQFTAIPLLFLVCVTWFVFVCGVYLYDATLPSQKKNFVHWGAQLFHNIWEFVGWSTFPDHFVHFDICWMLNICTTYCAFG